MPNADYRLSGTIEYGNDTTNAWFALSSSAEGKIVWSRTFEHVQAGAGAGVTPDSIVIALTNSLLQSYGVIRARDRAHQLASSEGDPRYRCILEAADAMRTGDRQSHESARACLEKLTKADPGFAVGFTFLSLMYNREFQLEYETRPGDPPPLDRALRAVRQAIALHPESSRGYLALLVIQFNRRDVAAALAAGEKCMALNKYDMLALGEYGGRLILAGDVDNGMRKLREAGAHGAVRPAWHHVYLSIGSYIGGDLAEAVRHADDIPNDNMALGQVARALAAKATGNAEGARKAIEQLLALAPSWRSNPRGELVRLIADEGIVDRLARDLAAAGLSNGT
jgi:tetratricopeptide (TPR) repeat protein